MFDSLSDKLERAFKVLKGQGKISEINVSETVKEIRKALLDADVNYKVAKQFTDIFLVFNSSAKHSVKPLKADLLLE